MERRLLLAFALTFLVIVITQPLISRYTRKAEPATPVAEEPSLPAASPAPAAPPTEGATPPAPVVAIQAASETEVVVENDLYRIVFTNRGAHVKSWVLKKYQNKPEGEPLELVHPAGASKHGYPLSLWTYDEDLRRHLDEALYATSQSGNLVAPATLTFEYADGETTVRKSFAFDHSYVLEVETSVTHKGGAVQAFPAWPAGFGDQENSLAYASARIIWQNGGKIERLEATKVSGGNTLSGPLHWAGTEDQYFGAVFLPDQPEKAAAVTLHQALEVPKNPEKPDPGETEKVSMLGVAVGDVGGATRQRLFVGPKAIDVLESVHASLTREERALLGPGAGEEAHGPDLRGMVDFGFFGLIARPLFLWLKWTHEHWVANWGWSILVLTVIINVALFPLKLSSMKSSLKMQKVAPQIKAVQEKYKKYKFNDPRRAEMNQEVSAIYKKESVNPVGGCLPMLIQFPFLIAFYTMLQVAIELRHAPWLWLKDLSGPDPYYVLPVGIGVSMFFVQKMTPQGAMDPMQQKMMNIMMPVMLGAISITLSSGLGLYWAMGNVIAVVQQMGMNRTKFGREIYAEMAKRAARKK